MVIVRFDPPRVRIATSSEWMMMRIEINDEYQLSWNPHGGWDIQERRADGRWEFYRYHPTAYAAISAVAKGSCFSADEVLTFT
jgi:hypothetical protein